MFQLEAVMTLVINVSYNCAETQCYRNIWKLHIQKKSERIKARVISEMCGYLSFFVWIRFDCYSNKI